MPLEPETLFLNLWPDTAIRKAHEELIFILLVAVKKKLLIEEAGEVNPFHFIMAHQNMGNICNGQNNR